MSNSSQTRRRSTPTKFSFRLPQTRESLIKHCEIKENYLSQFNSYLIGTTCAFVLPIRKTGLSLSSNHEKRRHMNRFIITNPANCIGCHTCEAACAVAHLDDAEVASMQQNSFQPRLKVVFGRLITTTSQCRHCDNAACVIACPTKALTHVGDTVQFVGERCFGCKTCVIACPYGAINLITKPAVKAIPHSISAQSVQPIAFKCDLCADRASGPACMAACPTKAIQLVTKNTTDDMQRIRREHAANNAAAGTIR